MRMAELALQRIMNDVSLQYPLLTVDIIFIDEIGQASSELMAVIDIILRTVRKSSVLYGGVTIFGTLDHTQIQPINSTPFLISSHMNSCWTFVRLSQSVRAHSDPDLQRLQVITRENPFSLRTDDDLKQEFFGLVRKLIKFVPSLDHPSITTNARVIFSRRNNVRHHIQNLTDRNIRRLTQLGIHHEIVISDDYEVLGSKSQTDWRPATPTTTTLMNQYYREPDKLVFTPYCMYECTTNDKKDGILTPI